MTTRQRALSVALAGLALCSTMVLCGCSTDTKLTPKEETMIQGTGKMPPEAQKRLAEKMAEARAKMQEQRSAAGNRPPGK